MAANFAVLSTSVVNPIAASATKTVIQLVAPANQALRVRGFGIGFVGAVVTDTPFQVEIVRQTTAGTASARNPLKSGVSGTTVQSTGQELFTGAEPTTTDILWADTVHPQLGAEISLVGREIVMDGGTRLAIRVIALAGAANNCRAHIDLEE